MLRFFAVSSNASNATMGFCAIKVERNPKSTSGSWPSTSILITPTRSPLPKTLRKILISLLQLDPNPRTIQSELRRPN